MAWRRSRVRSPSAPFHSRATKARSLPVQRLNVVRYHALAPRAERSDDEVSSWRDECELAAVGAPGCVNGRKICAFQHERSEPHQHVDATRASKRDELLLEGVRAKGGDTQALVRPLRDPHPACKYPPTWGEVERVFVHRACVGQHRLVRPGTADDVARRCAAAREEVEPLVGGESPIDQERLHDPCPPSRWVAY